MKLPIYQLDAFASERFTGNPAAVCLLDGWLEDDVLQAIAAENNLSETAFVVSENGAYRIRWFTPVAEVDLCGHATLAAAAVISRELEPGTDSVRFQSPSGELRVDVRDELLELDFPSKPVEEVEAPSALLVGLGVMPRQVFAADYYLVLYDSLQEVLALAPDYRRLASLDRIGIIATAPGEDVDFVSRFFAPKVGIAEDPVTGSAHCSLVPFWSARLGKESLTARQLSSRGGELVCEARGDRVGIAGRVVLYMKGKIHI